MRRELIKRINIAKNFFRNDIHPWLDKEGVLNKSFVGVSGSVAYGYADNLSDIELEVYVHKRLAKNKKKELGKIVHGKKELGGIRFSPGINTGWKLDLVLNNRMGEFWKKFDPYVLFEMTHALPIWDPMDIVKIIKKRVAFYPNSIFLKIIRGLWLITNENGWYNANFATQRGDETSAYIFLYRGTEALLRLIFMLNRKYYPHTKWLIKELG